MTSKLYAESAPRGFKAYQVEIPVAKVLNRIQEQGKQKVANIDAVAKADKERSRAWLDSKLHADKVTLDNIRENFRFSENNKERIAKAEQKELDNRVRSAQIEYNQNARRPPDKSLLEKLGPALAKAVPQIVGAVQAHQAGIDKAAGEAAQEMMWKLDITSAEYNDMISHHNSLRGDTVAQEAYYESLIGKFTDKTGHVFTRADFVRLLEDGTGAYSIAAQGVAAMNGLSAYEQNMKMWELENKRKYNDPVMYQQAVEEQSIVARNAAFGEGYLDNDASHFAKATKIIPETKKVIDAILSRHHTFLDREAHFAHTVRQSSDLNVIFSENDYAAIGPYMEGRRQIRGGDRNVANTETFDILDGLAQKGQLDLPDVNALLKYFRDSSGNQALGTPGNSNLSSQRIDRLRTLVLNSSHQTNNVIEREQALGIKHFREQVQTQLAEEPSAAMALKIREHVRNTHEWNSMPYAEQQKFNQLWGPLLKHPKADTRTIDQKLKVPGLSKVIKDYARAGVSKLVKDGSGVPLSTLEGGGLNASGALDKYGHMLERKILSLYANNADYRNDPEGSLWEVAEAAQKEVLLEAGASDMFEVDQDPKDPSAYFFTKGFKSSSTNSSNDERAQRLKVKKLIDTNSTDKVFFGDDEIDKPKFDKAAAVFRKMINKGEEITRQDILSQASNILALREAAERHPTVPLTELFANQLKVLHPDITIPDSAITTTEEIREAKEAINQTLLDLRNGRGVSTDTSMYFQSGEMPVMNPGVQRLAATSGIGGATPNYDNRSFAYTPEHRAFLDMIAFAEGTYDQPNSGYNTHFGFSQTTDLSRHPNKVITSGGRSSAAFGRYQFMPGTWNSVGGGEMTPDAQDWGAMRLALARLGYEQTTQGVQRLMNRLKTEGLSRGILDALAPEWASMPTAATGTSYYGQGGKSLDKLQSFYNKVLRQYGTTHGKVL